MAQRIVLIDDLDGSEASTTLTYTMDGQDYEIDLSEENTEKFRTDLAPYIEKSRPAERRTVLQTATRRRTRRRGGGASGRDDLPLIRAWAEAQGLGVSSRGRIKKEIIDQYDQEPSL